jgi:DNA-binding transcriptional LysR family regulator
VVRAAEGMEGSVCVGFTTSVAAHSFSSDVIRAYRRDYPRVALDLRESNAAELTDLTARGEMHVALLRLPVAKPPELVFDRLLDEEMLLVLPRDHALLKVKSRRAERPISLRRPANEPFILRRPERPACTQILACDEGRFPPQITARVDTC